MAWKKIKHIFCPDHNYSWMQSHASYPCAEQIGASAFRVYFSCRDAANKSSIAYVDMDMGSLGVTAICTEPVLSSGETGTFDDSGVSMSSLITIGDSRYLYYLGWNIMVTVPWRNCIGLAVQKPGETEFVRQSKAPVLGIHDIDPFTLTYPFVLYDEGIYKMWYGSSLYWGPKVFDTRHVIKYATSPDGVTWTRSGHTCIDTAGGEEFAIVKPFVIRENGLYKMWYAYRDSSYHLGYAESENGLDWKRLDQEVGIGVSESGWDSEMVCYPFIFDYNGRRYMLYNGNGYGKTGFGIAAWE